MDDKVILLKDEEVNLGENSGILDAFIWRFCSNKTYKKYQY